MNRTLKVRVGENYYLVDPNTAQAHAIYGPVERLQLPHFRQQEIAFDDPNSTYHFRSNDRKPFLITKAASEMYDDEVICGCLTVIQSLAVDHEGIDYLQVFEDESKPEALWFIDDGDGGAVTALLPSDY